MSKLSCAYCGKDLTGRYLIDYWGTTCCLEHQAQYPPCRFCGRLVPERAAGRLTALDTDVRCPICAASAVETAAAAEPHFRAVARWAATQGMTLPTTTRLRVELRDQAAMQPDIDEDDPQPWGLAQKRPRLADGRPAPATEPDRIIVQAGLPALLYEGTVLHELGHIWIGACGVDDLRKWEEEGFCRALSHSYYATIDTKEARYRGECITEASDPVYGEGFRRIHALISELGLLRVIAALRANRRLPWPDQEE